jgi:DNA-binding MarR family transcriptional regulator
MFMNEFCNCGLLRSSASHFTSIFNKALKTTGLNITQFVLLKYIFLLKQTNLNTLNKFLHQNRSTIGRNLNVIEKLNFISIKPGQDKREILINITPLGADALKNAYIIWKDVNDKINAKLGSKKDQLREIINEIKTINFLEE